MGFFQGAYDFEVNGGEFYDVRGGLTNHNHDNSVSLDGTQNQLTLAPNMSRHDNRAWNTHTHEQRLLAAYAGPMHSQHRTYPGYGGAIPSSSQSQQEQLGFDPALYQEYLQFLQFRQFQQQQQQYLQMQQSQWQQEQYQYQATAQQPPQAMPSQQDQPAQVASPQQQPAQFSQHTAQYGQVPRPPPIQSSTTTRARRTTVSDVTDNSDEEEDIQSMRLEFERHNLGGPATFSAHAGGSFASAQAGPGLAHAQAQTL